MHKRAPWPTVRDLRDVLIGPPHDSRAVPCADRYDSSLSRSRPRTPGSVYVVLVSLNASEANKRIVVRAAVSLSAHTCASRKPVTDLVRDYASSCLHVRYDSSCSATSLPRRTSSSESVWNPDLCGEPEPFKTIICVVTARRARMACFATSDPGSARRRRPCRRTGPAAVADRLRRGRLALSATGPQVSPVPCRCVHRRS